MNENNYQTIKKILANKNKKQLEKLIFLLLDSKNYETILLWANQFEKNQININDNLALAYWNKAQLKIQYLQTDIEDYYENQSYGYEDAENFENQKREIFDEFELLINKIINLKSLLSLTITKQIIEKIIDVYSDDSGFSSHNDYKSEIDESLINLCYILCDTNEKLEFLLSILLKYNDLHLHITADIYKKLNRYEDYLKLKLNNLTNADDFFEVATFFQGINDLTLALKYAYLGLKTQDYNTYKIINFLFDYHQSVQDSTALEQLVLTCENNNHDLCDLTKKMFNYYQQKDDYLNAKKHLIKLFDYTYIHQLHEQYKKIKQFLTTSDFNNIKDNLSLKAKEKSYKAYLEICLIDNNYQEIYNYIFNSSFYSKNNDDIDYFAYKIISIYPEEMNSYFFNKAIFLLEKKPHRKNYLQAKEYLEKVKEICINILNNNAEWQQKIALIKNKYGNRTLMLTLFETL